MSLEISTNLMIPEPAEEIITSEPWSMENYADGLMDELFSDIDSILDGNGNLPTQRVQQNSHNSTENWLTLAGEDDYQSQNPATYTQLQTLRVPHVVSGKPVPRVRKVPQPRNHQLSQFVFNTPIVKQGVPQRSRHWLRELLRLGATCGLAIAAMVWLINSGWLNRLGFTSFQQALEVPQPQLQPHLKPQVLTKADIEADMANYMLAALANIDRQQANNSLSARNVALTPRSAANPTNLAYTNTERPTNYLPNTRPSIPNLSTQAVERFIPIYQAPLPMRYVSPSLHNIASSLPPLPNVASQVGSNTAKLQDSVPTGQSNIKPVSINTTPITVGEAPKPVVSSLPQLPPVTAPETQQSIPAKPELASVVSSPATSHTLEGLLELGNKSAALFKINGISRRIEIGESIGSSGWTLVDVTKGEAIIRRNGEVRSIFVGQKF